MARPPQEAIDTFVSITGSDEALAVRKLEEHCGDLNEAVNAHFNGGDRTATRINQNPTPTADDDMMELDEPLDQTLVSHHREVIDLPIKVKDSNPQMGGSGQGPITEDVTPHESSYGPEVHGTVIIDDDDDDLPSALSARDTNTHSNVSSHSNNSVPSAPPFVAVTDYNNDIEEQMIRAAIEASKRDAEGLANGQTSSERENRPHGSDVDGLAQTAEGERAILQEGIEFGDHSSDLSDKEDMGGAIGTAGRQTLATGKVGTSGQSVYDESFQEETEDAEEQPLVRHRSRRIHSGNAESTQPAQMGDSLPLGPQPPSIQNDQQYNRDGFPSEEWGGISSEEHDEAVMLEAAMFGGIPEGAGYPFAFPSHRSSARYPQVAHSPSPTLTEQRLLREQQDDEYLASLQADQEKELKAMQEAKVRRLEEAAAREAALEKQKQEEEERQRKQLEEAELESKLAAKQASLPQEPPPDEEGAVTLVVRMPDGSRQGRRFLKSDKLQSLFDYIDISRTFKPGTYRLVRSYPRRAFTDGEGELSLSDLGLTSKQEALFLEKIPE